MSVCDVVWVEDEGEVGLLRRWSAGTGRGTKDRRPFCWAEVGIYGIMVFGILVALVVHLERMEEGT